MYENIILKLSIHTLTHMQKTQFNILVLSLQIPMPVFPYVLGGEIPCSGAPTPNLHTHPTHWLAQFSFASQVACFIRHSSVLSPPPSWAQNLEIFLQALVSH